jgi:hypothetical protein
MNPARRGEDEVPSRTAQRDVARTPALAQLLKPHRAVMAARPKSAPVSGEPGGLTDLIGDWDAPPGGDKRARSEFPPLGDQPAVPCCDLVFVSGSLAVHLVIGNRYRPSASWSSTVLRARTASAVLRLRAAELVAS